MTDNINEQKELMKLRRKIEASAQSLERIKQQELHTYQAKKYARLLALRNMTADEVDQYLEENIDFDPMKAKGQGFNNNFIIDELDIDYPEDPYNAYKVSVKIQALQELQPNITQEVYHQLKQRYDQIGLEYAENTSEYPPYEYRSYGSWKHPEWIDNNIYTFQYWEDIKDRLTRIR